MCRVVALLLLATAASALRAGPPGSTRLSGYDRPPPSPPLPPHHPALARAAGPPHAPEQRMLSLAGPGAVTITWVTHPDVDEGLLAAPRDAALTRRHRDRGCRHLAGLALPSIVRYGRVDGKDAVGGPGPHLGAAVAGGSLDPATLPRAASGGFTCYDADDYESGALHSATMGDADGGPLDGGAAYVYAVSGDPAGAVWSTPQPFTAPPPATADALPYTIAVVGDLGQTADSAETLAGVAARPGAGHVINVGDLSYADGYHPRWDTWGRLIDYHAAGVPWMVVEGNHELEIAGSRGAAFVAYNARFAVPANASGSRTKMYYSYEVPGATVVALGTYDDWGPGSAQRAWLRRTLARVDRGRTPWLLVFMHAPWYSSNLAHLEEVDGMRRSLEPLLATVGGGADAVFYGHVHAYERVAPALKRRADPCGPVHIVIGDGGNREGPAPHWLDPAPRWSLVRDPSFGAGELVLVNGTHARWEWRRNGDGPGAPPADAAWLVRGGGRGGACGVRGWLGGGGGAVAAA